MHDEQRPDDELELLKDLPPLAPSRVLEVRTVQALRTRGLLQPAASRALPSWIWAAAAVFVLLVFSAGYVAGRANPRGTGEPTAQGTGGGERGRSNGVAGRTDDKPQDVTVADDAQTAKDPRYVLWF